MKKVKTKNQKKKSIYKKEKNNKINKNKNKKTLKLFDYLNND